MNCEQARENVYDLLLDLLETDVRKEVEAHLSACDSCRQAREKAAKALAIVERWEPKPSTSTIMKPAPMTTRRALSPRVSRPWKPFLSMAGAAAVLLGILFVVSQPRRPVPDAETLGQASRSVDVPPAAAVKPAEIVAPPGAEPRPIEKPAPPPVAALPPSAADSAPRPPVPAPRRIDPVAPPTPEKKAPEKPVEPKIEPAGKTTAPLLARVERIRGDVRVWTGAPGDRRATEGQMLSPGERLLTQDKESLASLRFPNALQLNLSGATEVQIAAPNEVLLVRGALEVDAQKRERGSELTVSTANAIVEVLEARFTLERKDDLTLLQVRQGLVQFTNLVNGKVFQAKPGQNAKAEGHPKVDQRKVDVAVANGVTYLRGTGLAGLRGGSDELELVLYTLLHAGVPEADRDVQDLLKNMLALEPQRTYNTALRAMILEKLGRVRFQEEIWKCAQFLIDNQGPNGTWSYGTPTTYGPLPKAVPTGAKPDTASGGGRPKAVDFSQPDRKILRRIPVTKQRDGQAGDNSNSQYAALGLRACYDAGIDLPKDLVTKARKWLADCQLKEDAAAAAKDSVASGPNAAPPRGWSYGSGLTPYGSMSAGAIGSICIYDYILDGEKSLSWKRDKEVLSGLAWLAQNFSPTGNPGVDKAVGNSYSLTPDGAMYYYYLYAVERAGLLFGTEKFGAHEWYPEGANVLLKSQLADGSWPHSDTHRKGVWNTCFTILFLRRATRPLQDVASEDSKSRKPPAAEK
ncbi:MAG TPA: FecR domain-containing protein [Planctomycetota bacterium]|nr:FecR domain-containing protein [Planctomycetota bacterium]